MKNIMNILNDMISELVEHGYQDDDTITEIKVNPGIFDRILLESGNLPNKNSVLTFYSQLGSIVIKKDNQPLINKKASQIHKLQEEIKELEE